MLNRSPLNSRPLNAAGGNASGGSLNAAPLNSAALNGAGAAGSAGSVEQNTGRVSLTLTQRVVRQGQVAIALVQEVYAQGSVSLALTQKVVAPSGRVRLPLVQRVVERGAVSLTLTQAVQNPTGQVGVDLTQRVVERGAVGLTLTQAVVSPQERGERYRVQVLLGGEDVSQRVVGEVSVEAEEGLARVADLALRAPQGALAVEDYLGRPLAVDYQPVAPDGSVASGVPLFRGRVDRPVLDPARGVVELTATDDRQNRIRALSRAEIDALTPGGHYIPELDDGDAEGNDYAEIRLASLPASLHLDVAGGWELSPWAAAGAPDYTLTPSDLVDDGVGVQLADRSDFVNTVRVAFDYRYQRDTERTARVSWRYPFGFCDGRPYTKPTDEMIESAVEGTGWRLDGSITHRRLPPSGTILCGTNRVAWVISEALRQRLSVGFGAYLRRRFRRYVTERYELDVVSQASITQNGKLLQRERYGVSVEPPEQWDDSVTVQSWDDQDARDRWLERHDPARGRAAVDDAIAAALARARREILSSHRTHRVRCTAPIIPHADRQQTVAVDTPSVAARGKVRLVRHRLNVGTGRAVTEIELAVSRAAAGEPEDALTAPAPPAKPRAEEEVAIGLPSRFGAEEGALPYNENWTGYTGNWASGVNIEEPVRSAAADAPGPVYPQRFRIEMPEIAREPFEVTASGQYRVRVPHDPLTLTVQEATWP